MPAQGRSKIAQCPNPKCGKAIWSDHLNSWCIECGEPLPEPIRSLVPHLQQLKAEAGRERASLSVASDDGYRSTYKTARGMAELMSSIGWLSVAVAGVILLMAMSQGAGFVFVAMAPALGVALGGFLLVSMGQLTRAAVDTADHTGAILSILTTAQNLSITAAPTGKESTQVDGSQEMK